MEVPKEYSFTVNQLCELLRNCLDMFTEFQAQHDKEENEAKACTVLEIVEGLDAETFLESIGEGKRTMQL